ncbi:hypothetical protein E0H75_29645 [Kribbella capetownensis]|uniref:Lipoprotein n=1 Tax=Kribbella capetownensis TaxID=1572659 RepID=A0A4R0JM09_9ACTN|nr:hypothetical protein [Kribbella capetownensis]TCC45878.1 hypothetical protein E0H75_29645 [Kribbella capetownensis]
MVRSRLAVLLLAPLAVLPAACGGGDDTSGLPTVTETAPASTTPTATPSGTPTAPASKPTSAPTQASAKYRDLTLVLRRSATINAKTEPAVTKFLKLHAAFGAMAGGKNAPSDLSTTASPAVVKTLGDLLKTQRQKKERGGGTLVVRVVKAEAGASTAVVEGCFDQRKVVMIRPDGTKYVDATVQQMPTMLARATVSATGGTWRVTEYTLSEGSC